MEDTLQREQRLEEIQQQVEKGLGLSSSGPQIISEEPADKQKYILKNALAAVGILVFAVVSIILLFPRKPIPSKSTTIVQQITPTPEEQSVVTLNTQYANPFDKNTQYTNPFSQNTNPFDNLSQ